MTTEQFKDWLYRLRSEIDFMSVNPEHRENFKMSIDEGIKAIETVEEFELDDTSRKRTSQWMPRENDHKD